VTMLVVLAREHDEEAARLVVQWASLGAVQLTPRDLSRPGWNQEHGRRRYQTAVIAGNRVGNDSIGAVLVRLAAVTAFDLPHVSPLDRSYVAAEMTAFLVFWLGSLGTRVVNRPIEGCLGGPPWPQAQWISEAARIGLPVVPFTRSTLQRRGVPDESMPTAPMNGDTVTVVGDKCVNSRSAVHAEHAKALAQSCGVDLLSVTFGTDNCEKGNSFLIAASPWPSLSDMRVSNELRRFLQEVMRANV
jgi:hypothetical protein